MKQSILAGLAAGLTVVLVNALWHLVFSAGGADSFVVAVEPVEKFLPAKKPGSRSASASKVDQIIRGVAFNEQAFASVLDDLHQSTDINIIVDWKSIEAAGIERKTPITLSVAGVPARTVIQSILHKAQGIFNLGYRVEPDGSVFITTDDVLEKEELTVVYNIRDIIIESMTFRRSAYAAAGAIVAKSKKPGASGIVVNSDPVDPIQNEEAIAKELMEAIRSEIKRESWVENGGKIGRMYYIGGKLIVTLSQPGHDELDVFLAKLREK